MSERWKVVVHFLNREAAKRFQRALIAINSDLNDKAVVLPVHTSCQKASEGDE